MNNPTPAEALTEPRAGECPLCYVERMLDAFGCDGTLRWTGRWRDRARPRAVGLERRLEIVGIGSDCQVPRRPAALVRALGREATPRRRR